MYPPLPPVTAFPDKHAANSIGVLLYTRMYLQFWRSVVVILVPSRAFSPSHAASDETPQTFARETLHAVYTKYDFVSYIIHQRYCTVGLLHYVNLAVWRHSKPSHYCLRTGSANQRADLVSWRCKNQKSCIWKKWVMSQYMCLLPSQTPSQPNSPPDLRSSDVTNGRVHAFEDNQ